MMIGSIVRLRHVSGWGVLGLLVFEAMNGRAANPGAPSWRRRLLMLPFFVLAAGATVGAAAAANWCPTAPRQRSTSGRSGARRCAPRSRIDYSSVIAIGIVLVGSMAFRRFDGRLGWAAIMMLVGSLVMPRHILAAITSMRG